MNFGNSEELVPVESRDLLRPPRRTGFNARETEPSPQRPRNKKRDSV